MNYFQKLIFAERNWKNVIFFFIVFDIQFSRELPQPFGYSSAHSILSSILSFSVQKNWNEDLRVVKNTHTHTHSASYTLVSFVGSLARHHLSRAHQRWRCDFIRDRWNDDLSPWDLPDPTWGLDLTLTWLLTLREGSATMPCRFGLRTARAESQVRFEANNY